MAGDTAGGSVELSVIPDNEHYHPWATYRNLSCYSFGCAVLGNRLNVRSHHNHHQQQHIRMTTVSADKEHTDLIAICSGRLKNPHSHPHFTR